MKNSLHAGRLFLLALVSFLMIGGARATSAHTDLSDIWWNPAESGWGMQMVNTGIFVFATIYIYGPDGKPMWLTGQLTLSGAGGVTYSGPLYATTGPYFGGPFNPGAVGATQVGTMTFVLTTVTSGQLTYTVDGVVVTKSVQRQPLTLDDYSGDYDAIFTQTISNCSNPFDNGTITDRRVVNITQNGTAVAVVATAANGFACTINGTFSQSGRMGRVQGAYACTSGEVGSLTIFAMNSVPFMFTARLQGQSSNFGCTTSGEVTGVIPR